MDCIAFWELLSLISHIRMMLVLSLVIPYIFSLWLKLPVFDMFRELQLMDEILREVLQFTAIGVLLFKTVSRQMASISKVFWALHGPSFPILAFGPKARECILTILQIISRIRFHAHLFGGAWSIFFSWRVVI